MIDNHQENGDLEAELQALVKFGQFLRTLSADEKEALARAAARLSLPAALVTTTTHRQGRGVYWLPEDPP